MIVLLSAGVLAQQASSSDAQNLSGNKRTPEEIRKSFHAMAKTHVRTSPKIRHPGAAEALNPPVLAQLRAQKAGANVGVGHTMGASGDAGTSGSTPPGGCDPAATPSSPATAAGAASKDKDKDHHHASGSGSNPPGAPGQPCGNNPPAGSANPTGGNPSGSSNPPAGTPGANPTGSSNPPAGSPGSTPPGGGGTPPSAAGPSHGRPVVVAAMATAPVAVMTPPPPSQPTSNTSSKYGKAIPSLAAICPPGNSPAVFDVNNRPASTILFTQDPNGNEYTIHGCRFGNNRGDVLLEGGFRSGNVSFVIDSWSDTLIKAHLSPSLAGESDLNNVTLVVVPSGGQIAAAKFPGYKFYAQRETVTLQSVPQGSVTMAGVTDSSGGPVKSKFSSPYVPSDAPGTKLTGGVDRENWYRFGPGADAWDLGGLAPGFVPVDFQLHHWALETCPSTGLSIQDPTIYDDGQWGAQWNNNTIIVTFAEQHCHIPGGWGGVAIDDSNSSYALTIEVAGPKGVNPWAK